jgi:hypothetical protein
MIVYVGQTRSRALMATLDRHAVREFVVRGELPARRTSFGFAHDNGAYRDWRAGRAFNVVRWDRDMRWISYRGIVPDFVVVPDIVAGGLASLAWSAAWRDVVPAEFPAYLAVQDGMTARDVIPHLARYAGIFVGGSLPWKLATGAAWVQLARERGLRCHIGRVGTAARVRWARAAGATSIDSCLPLRAEEHLAAFLAAIRDADQVATAAGNEAPPRAPCRPRDRGAR